MSSIVELQTKLDAYRAMREKRLAKHRETEALKEQELALQYQLISYLHDHPEVNGIVGKTHKAVLRRSTVPIIQDRDKLRDYILQSREWDLISMRLSTEAVRQRWEEEEEVPGVGTIEETKLSVTKI
jgi:hypothetical protein